MTNPNNIVRVRARNGGRASVYEANAWCQAFSSGILEGVGVVQNTSADMNVLVGGSATKPDVLIAQNPAGYKIALDIIGQQAVALAAPASNSRISAIVAYTDDIALSTTQSDVTGSPSSCGLIVVNGTAAASPVAPTDAQIREAITADGATGSQASYCVIATITVASNTTMITDSLISTNQAAIGAKNIGSTTSEVTLTFHVGGASGTVAGTRQATLIELSGNIGVLSYNGGTGYNDAASGDRQMTTTFDAGFSRIIGSAVNSYYAGNTSAYQTYCHASPEVIDNYVRKEGTNNQERMIEFVLVGLLA